MSKMFNKIRSFLIKLLAGKNMTIIVNTTIDSKKGIVVNEDYIVINNVNIEGFETAFTIECAKTTIDNKNLTIDNKLL